ncbi:MAG: HDOD domain-containing protein [Dissulfuribacterales bacterium]
MDKMEPINSKIKKEKRVKLLVNSTFDQIPPWPKTIQQLMPLLQEMAPISKIREVIVLDPGISAAVLALARSPYYCRRAKIESIDDAIVRLGQRQLIEVCTLALGARVLSGVKTEYYGIKSGFLCNHSVAVAMLLQKLAQVFNQKKPLAAYTAGLLHDTGKLVLALKTTKEQCTEIQEKYANNPNLSFCDTEDEVLGINHAETGAELAIRWNLPELVVDVIRWHHNPAEAKNSRWLSMIYLAYAANKIALAYYKGEIPDNLQNNPVMIRLKINNEKARKLVSWLSRKIKSIQNPC